MANIKLYTHKGALRLMWAGDETERVIELLPDGRVFLVDLVYTDMGQGTKVREEFTLVTDLYGLLKAIHEMDEIEKGDDEEL